MLLTHFKDLCTKSTPYRLCVLLYATLTASLRLMSLWPCQGRLQKAAFEVSRHMGRWDDVPVDGCMRNCQISSGSTSFWLAVWPFSIGAIKALLLRRLFLHTSTQRLLAVSTFWKLSVPIRTLKKQMFRQCSDTLNIFFSISWAYVQPEFFWEVLVFNNSGQFS